MATVSILLPGILRAVFLVLVLIGVVSCATMVSRENAVNNLRNAHSCCEGINQFKYDQLPEAEGISFGLDASSDAFNFPSGKSYFKAFKLPGKAIPYYIIITSWALGDNRNNAHIFYPQVALLDSNFSIVEQSTPGDFVLSKAGVGETLSETGGLTIKFEGSVLIDDTSVKCILVYTTQELMNNASPLVVRQAIPIIMPGLVTAIPGPEETVFIQHSPFGLLHIEIAPID